MYSIPKFPSHQCRISDDWKYKGMRVVWLENNLVRIGILVDRGSDIFEFIYKPYDLNFLLRLNKAIHNPHKVFSQLRDTPNQMEDYYYGGWQEALPNSTPFVYRGASLGQHGEVWMIPWKHAIMENSPEKVSVRVWTQPLRMPITIEKTLSIKKGNPSLFINEKLKNTSNTDLELMWGHHIAFGLPFLKEGAIISTNAKTFIAEPKMPAQRRFLPGIEMAWPHVKDIQGNEDNAAHIPPEKALPYSDLAFLSGYSSKAYYTLKNVEKDVGFAVQWEGNLFKHLWYWQERYATQDAPWWGSAYAIGLEPWTTKYNPDPDAAIKKGEYLKLKAGQCIETQLNASPFENEFQIT